MQKYLLFLVIPFTVLSETCEELKTQAISNITSSESLLADNSRYIYYTYQNITSLGGTLDVLDQRTSGDPYVNTARHQVSLILQGVQLVEQNENTISNYLSTSRSLLSSIDCSCDESGICPCDFSEIIQLLTSISSSTSDAYIELQSHGLYLSQIDDSLTQIETLLETGFGGVTNTLINGFSSITNQLRFLLGSSMTYPSSVSGNTELGTYYLKKNNNTFASKNWAIAPSGLLPNSSGGWLRMFQWFFGNVGSHLVSYENYAYDFEKNRFPILTNTVGAIHRDTTNFFSFFRGEIGVQGVLEDWTNEESDGTYHDFLTNHYINVVRGGSLSGNTSSKTNWFSRIETLLASLVFLDSSNTNAYDSASQSVSNSINRVKDDFNNTLDGVSSASSTQMELVSDIEKSMYESLRSFSQAFSSASLPSSVRLIYVYKTSGSRSLSLSSDTVDVTVPVEGKLMDFVEIIRSATTLCWVFFGLWFMFKFSVWTVKKIYMLIRYIIDFFNMVAGGK